MRYNKYIDQNDIKECAEAGIRNAIVHNRALLGIQIDKLVKFANYWVDIVLHSIPTEYVEQLTRASLVGEIIADYTNQERAKNPTDFGMLVESMNDPAACYPNTEIMASTIMNNVVNELSKHCFEPDIDAYTKYRRFTFESYHKMILDTSVPGFRLMPNDPNMLTNNMHIFTAFTKWIIDKISRKIEKDQLMIEFTKVPDVMYNVLKEYVSRYGWDSFIEEADSVHMYLSPAREMTRAIDHYFEERIDTAIRLELNKILLVASNKITEDFRVNGISVGVDEATWNKILATAGLNIVGVASGSGIMVTNVTSETISSGYTKITTKCIVANGVTAEITYDSQGNVLGTVITPNYLSWGLSGTFGGTPIYKTDDYYRTWIDDAWGELLNNQINTEIDAEIAKLNNTGLPVSSRQDYADAVSTGAKWNYVTDEAYGLF